MKQTIFNKLKQAYSPLGLGDEILLGQAEALASTGLVTQENVDQVVAAQRQFLEQLQKTNDKRATEAAQTAAKSAQDKAAKAAEEAARKAAEERAKAVDEASRKAVEDYVAKAKAEAERKAKEEAERNTMPDWYVKDREEQAKLIAELKAAQQSAAKAAKEQAELSVKQQQEQAQRIEALVKENEAFKAGQRRAAREELVRSKAAEMGVPEWRVAEGFYGITDDSTDEEVTAVIATAAKNIKAQQLEQGRDRRFPIDDGKPSAEQMRDLAKQLVK